ncbi:dual specificity protein phosphatase 3-like isoform X1 [Pollicipes pollicipes]|uniref:dual specificity protein phosphatase 3-like isoform X1 n=1 Tax=Pollicipes pollicipes TaxID=41117 RepID=UPI0018854534|nr:dual specificity protein phosphatase 3-like isoform X1 [Pollicipes pollicipes]
MSSRGLLERTDRNAWRDIRSPLTVEDLRDMLVAPSHGRIAFPSKPYDEVYPGIYIGDGATALSLTVLRSLKVTHVLNAAHGRDNATYAGCYVRTRASFYSAAGMIFLGVPAVDTRECNICVHFEEAADFIAAALEQNGKVLVHCVQGLSRSATLVIAYLMIKLHMPLSQALQTVRARREIFPNDGFLQQLIRLNDQLMGSRRVNVSWL